MSYSFETIVYITRRPHMRDDNLEYLSYIGQGILRQIFDEERVDLTVKEAKFFYPERWCNIVEERSLYDRLRKYCPNLEKLEIWTQSVYIIQCTPSESCRIVSSEDEQERGLPQESDTGRLWNKNVHGYDFSKLQVFGNKL